MPVTHECVLTSKNWPFETNHAFIIGCDNYRFHKTNKLLTAIKDAKEIAKVLKKEQKFKVHPLLLDATKSEIESFMSNMHKKIGAHDRVFFYFAGHGTAKDGKDQPEGHIIPVDADWNPKSHIPMKTLYDSLLKLKCRHLLVVLDCCFSGSFEWNTRYRDDDTLIPKYIYKERFERFTREKAWQVITSSAHHQKAQDTINGKHSPFAEALIKGLQGEADMVPRPDGDGLITGSELFLYIKESVESQTTELNVLRRQTPRMFQFHPGDIGEFLFFHPSNPLILPPKPSRNPYKGLRAYNEKDRNLFYGRQEAVKQLLEKVERNSFIVVTGASGSGKSSLVKAGLIPELRLQNYRISSIIKPGKHPLKQLEKIIPKLFPGSKNSKKKVSQPSVIVVDQLEELYTLCQDPIERKQFVIKLKSILDVERKRAIKIIVTVRSDFETQFHDTGVTNNWEEVCFRVPSFTIREMREIILSPAIQAVLYIDPPELVDKLISEFYSYPGALPLLSFTMSEWYRLYIKSGRSDRKLNKEDFEKMKGGFGALNNRANEILYKMGSASKKTLEKIMLRLVSMEGDEPAGKKASMDDLNFSSEEFPLVEKIIDKMVKTRLLVKSREDDEKTYVQPAHDALIGSWTTFTKWRDDYGKDNILLLHKLEAAEKEYREHIAVGDIKKSKKFLWNNNPRLDWAINQLQNRETPLNFHEKEFINQSVAKKKRKKNAAWLIAVTVIIILSVSLIFALTESRRASNEARIATVNYLTSQAQLHVKNDPLKAIRLAEEAHRLECKPLVMRVLSEAAAESLDKPFYSSVLKHENQKAVNHAEFSPSGDRIITASQDGAARLWDLDGKLLKTFNHNDIVYHARFSPDGLNILTSSSDGTAKLWNLKGKLLTAIQGHRDKVYDALFSPDGSKILTISRDNNAKLWTAKGLPIISCQHLNNVTHADFSPDGDYFFTISEGSAFRLWNLKGIQSMAFENVIHACFSPPGKNLIYMASPSGVVIRNIQNQTEKTYIQFKKTIHFTTFSPDSKHILIVFQGGGLSLWNPQEEALLLFKHSHTRPIESAYFSPDGSRILTASKDNTARLWNLQGRTLTIFSGHIDSLCMASFSPDGSRIITASKDHSARIWEVKNRLVTDFNAHNDKIIDGGFSPGGDRMVTASYDHSAGVWDQEGKLLARLSGHKGILNSVEFSPDGTKIVTTSADHNATIWSLPGYSVTQLKGHGANVNSAVFSPNGEKILTASDDGCAILWDTSGKFLNRFEHKKYVNWARFSPDGSKILTASNDQTAALWDTEGKRQSLLDFHNDIVYSAVFSPDGTKILTASADGSAILSDLDGKPLVMYKHKNNVNSALFSPDGRHILTSSYDYTVVLWNLEGKPVTRFIGHSGIIHSTVFSADGLRILTASDDNLVKLWDINGNLLANFDKHRDAVQKALFSPDGTRILSVSDDGTAKLWHTPGSIITWLKTARLPFLDLDMKKGDLTLK